MNNTFIINSLTTILDTYRSMIAFFYKKVLQTKYTNVDLAKYPINYNLLLPSSQFVIFLNENQVNAQIQAYINLCKALVVYITTNVSTQNILFFEQIQGQLNDSITQLNGLALSLLEAQYDAVFSYTVPNDMSMSNAIYLNDLDMDSYSKQAALNYDLTDFNDIKKDTILIFSR